MDVSDRLSAGIGNRPIIVYYNSFAAQQRSIRAELRLYELGAGGDLGGERLRLPLASGEVRAKWNFGSRCAISHR